MPGSNSCSSVACSETVVGPRSTTLADLSQLLQNQQAILLKVMEQQEEFKQQQTQFENRLDGIESDIGAISSQVQQKVQKSKTKGGRLPRDLTNKISSVYTNLEPKFKPSESSTSPHNKSVRKALFDQVTPLVDENSDVVGAIQRKYESVRRLWLVEGKPDSENIMREAAHQKKLRSRRKRKFDNRKCVVRENEKKYWEPLSIDFMTDESDDDEDSNRIVEHKLPWRSDDLNSFLATLDKRYTKKVSKAGGTVAKKMRIIGEPSSTSIPIGAPQWTINPVFQD